MKTPAKHFLDLSDIPAEELRRILDAGAAIKAVRRLSLIHISEPTRPY